MTKASLGGYVEGRDATAWPDDAIEVGRIVGAWGIKGWVKVLPFSSDPQALFSSCRWLLKPPEAQGVLPPAARGTTPFPSLLKVIEAKSHGDVVVAQVQEVDDRNGAEALRAARVFVPRGSFPTLELDEYYWIDLIGLDVVNREGTELGSVAGLLDTGPHSVLRVVARNAKPDDEERLIPFVAAYVDEVSFEQRRITVDWGVDF